jgi:flagellar motor protein MotB
MFKISGWLGVATVLTGALVLGGCDDMKEKNAALMTENQELHKELASTREALEAAEKERAANVATIADGAKPAPSDMPAGKPRAGSNTPADFGGIEGVEASSTAGGVLLRLPGDVLFASGQATLKGDAQKSLAKIAAVIKGKYGNKPIRIEGFSDSDPIRHSKWKDNLELSSARAQSVQRYLASQGVTNKIVAVGLGSEHPRATKAQSRRVEIVVTK